MRLRSKMGLVLSVLLLMLVTGTLIINHCIVLPQFVQIENAHAEEDVARCREAIRRDCEFLSATVQDWSAWTDTYQYVVDRNQKYQEQTLAPQSFASLKINLIALVGPDGQLVWGEIRDPKTEELMEVPGLLERVTRPDSRLVRFSEPDDETSGLMMTARGAMFVSARPIVTSERQGPIRGAVIMGKFLDEDGVQELARRTRVRLQLRLLQGDAVAPGDRQIAALLTRPDEVYLTQISPDVLRGYGVIRDVYGAPLLLLDAELPRTMSQRGRDAAHVAVLSSVLGGVLIIGVLWFLMRRFVVDPLSRLTAHAVSVGSEGNLQAQLNLPQTDEIGILGGEFDRMVRRLAEWHAKLTDAAREAGKAEIASSVLHNVGNVLNSVNTSAGLVVDKLRSSEVGSLVMAKRLIEQNSADLAGFLSRDEKGRQLPAFLNMLCQALEGEQQTMLREMENVTRSLEHIGQIIKLHHSPAGHERVLEMVNPADIIEQAIKLCVEPGGDCGVALTRRIEWTGPALLDRNKVLQILVNLISNARNAVLESGRSDAAIEIALEPAGPDGQAIRFSVSDNGVGISPDDLPRLFAFGFSRRCDGHGFGLHSCANLARQMGATLTAHSDGLGKGARFCLEIPAVDKVQTVPK